MSDGSGRWVNLLQNVALIGLGLVVLVLIYAFVTGTILSSSDDAHRESNPGDLVGDIIQVEVRNGCGVSGLAEGMTRFLRDRGFDVVGVGNYSSFDQSKTLVIDRVGDLEAARKVAASIGLPEDRVVQEIRQDYFLDASVIIGADYQTLSPFEDE